MWPSPAWPEQTTLVHPKPPSSQTKSAGGQVATPNSPGRPDLEAYSPIPAWGSPLALCYTRQLFLQAAAVITLATWPLYISFFKKEEYIYSYDWPSSLAKLGCGQARAWPPRGHEPRIKYLHTLAPAPSLLFPRLAIPLDTSTLTSIEVSFDILMEGSIMLPHEQETWRDTLQRSVKRGILEHRSTTIRIPQRYLLLLKDNNISLTRFVTDALRQALESFNIDITKPHPAEHWGEIEGKRLTWEEYAKEMGTDLKALTK